MHEFKKVKKKKKDKGDNIKFFSLIVSSFMWKKNLENYYAYLVQENDC